MKTGEPIFVNLRRGSVGQVATAWVGYSVVYTFADGNAVLIREPDCVAYTGDMQVGTHMRRKGETYADGYPGP